MNTDIRLSTEFWDHPKTVKLERRLGLQGPKSLQILWAWAAKYHADGRLEGEDIEAIEIAAKWPGNESTFVETLVSLRWLDQDGDTFCLHDWQEHNSWAAKADCRSDKARLSRMGKTHPELYRELTKDGKQGISREEYEALTNVERTSTVASTPSPAPSPAPAPIAPRDRPSDEGLLPTSPPDGGPAGHLSQSEPETGQSAREDDAPQRARDDCPHAEIVALYHERLEVLPKVRVWGPENRAQLRSRWREDKERQSLDWWREYFDRVQACDFLCGRKAGTKGAFFASLSWLVNRTNLGKVLNGQFDNRGPSTGSRQADRNALAAQAFVQGG